MIYYSLELVCDGCHRSAVKFPPQLTPVLKEIAERAAELGWRRGKGNRKHECPACAKRGAGK